MVSGAIGDYTAPSSAQPGSASVSWRSKPQLLGLDVWCETDVGRERDVNEDAVYPDHLGGKRFYVPSAELLARKGQLLLVADGIGGEQVGSAASQWAIRLVAERYYALAGDDFTADLREALEQTNVALHRYLQDTGATQAGSTMVAAVVHQGVLYLANVGDSRAYLLRDGVLYQQSRDHTLAQQKAERGVIAQAEVANDPDASVLTRALGAAASVVIDVFRPVPLAPGDVVVLCSDGLYDMVPDAEIVRTVLSGAPRRAVERLIEMANARGGYDNISVLLARVGNAAMPATATLGYVSALREDFAQLEPSRRQMLWIALLVIAFVIFAAMLVIGWGLYSPAPETAPAAVSALMALSQRRWGGENAW